MVRGWHRHGLDPAWRRMRGRGTLSQTCAWFEDGVLPDASAIVVLRRGGMERWWLLDVWMHRATGVLKICVRGTGLSLLLARAKLDMSDQRW